MSKIHAEPTKNFFINMITRDIGLNDCIYDLIDNCLDGATQENLRLKKESDDLKGYFADIEITKDKFSIKDNCGGISIDEATNYAFHFGRKDNDPQIGRKSIGLYGIGMKRAIFKIGRFIVIKSETFNEAFKVDIDVENWAISPKWEFELVQQTVTGNLGTTITITKITNDISASFNDEAFINTLNRNIAKYYALFMEKGFKVKLNGKSIKPYIYKFEVSEDIIPANFTYIDEPSNIEVQIISGIAASPPDDFSAEVKQRNPENWGWYVVCNDRVVIAGDKTSDTIWGDNGFTRWHPQYNGFMGMVKFTSDDASLLPWTTTKREIDQSSGVYRRALIKMKESTKPITNYTSARKENKEEAKSIESKAVATPVFNLSKSTTIRTPVFKASPKKTTIIQYNKPIEIVEKVAKSLGSKRMSNKDVGIKTFNYYVENEIED